MLWIVTDGSVKNRGIAATLYVRRSDELLLAGFFNAKLRMHQITWLPYEIEASSIGAAIKHFVPFFIQSSHATEVHTVLTRYRGSYSPHTLPRFIQSSHATEVHTVLTRYRGSYSPHTLPRFIQSSHATEVHTVLTRYRGSYSPHTLPRF